MTKTTKPPVSPKRRDNDQRRDDIMSAAETLFAERGVSGTSIEAIVERAQCSKSAVYGLFGSKENLLAALTVRITQGLNEELTALTLGHLPMRDFLQAYVEKAMAMILTARHIGVVRTIFGEMGSAPQLSRTFYRVGPGAAQEALAKAFETKTREGVLTVDDPEVAAAQLYGLMLWGTMFPLITGADRSIGKARVARFAESAVDGFLRMYGVAEPADPASESCPVKGGRHAGGR